MQDTIRVTPTLIRRLLPGKIEIADVPSGVAGAEGRALLVFINEEQAEAFRRKTGCFPASEGFIAQVTNLEGLKAIRYAWKFQRVALRGPEPDTVSEYAADDFMTMLEGAEMVHPDDLQILDRGTPFVVSQPTTTRRRIWARRSRWRRSSTCP
jgi:hypothetical protein